MRYKFLLVIIALMFTNLHSMEANENEPSNQSTIEVIQIFNQPEMLVNLVANYLACKLIHDIKSEISNQNVGDYEEYLASCPLNKEAQELVLRALAENENQLLWKILPYEITQQNLGIVRDLVILNDNQLLAFYSHPSESLESSRYITKLKIWDMRFNNWVDIEIEQPEIFIDDWLRSKDSKTLFLLHDRYCVLVYDLSEFKVKSKIISSPHAIKSICLFRDDNFVCCGLENGMVAFFDKNTAKEVFSFKASNVAIESINSRNDLILSASSSEISRWKFNKNEWLIDKSVEIQYYLNGHILLNARFGFDKKNILINLIIDDHGVIEFLAFPDLKCLKGYEIGLFVCKSDQAGTIFSIEKEKFDDLGFVFRSLMLLDVKSGEVIRRLDLDSKEFSSDNKPSIIWNGVAVSPDYGFIVIYNYEGAIAKISLGLDEGLENILEKIKLNLNNAKMQSASKSKCLIS